ncbi:response regulator [Desulfovibrio sp. OttesenSCG-928-C14]|nr:response regulator [Desulfovibrio sp. OttesenSCG-928-C14]
MKKTTDSTAPLSKAEALARKAEYLNLCVERDTAKILQLDTQLIAIRHELEQKRRGFALMAELAVNMGRDVDYNDIFLSVSRRINSSLNMQRTAVLVPEPDGRFRPMVLQGYTPEADERISKRLVPLPETLRAGYPIMVTGDAPEEHLASLRNCLELPFLIAAPVVLHNQVAAILITGRVVEQHPFLLRLGKNDMETVQTVSAYLAAMLAGQRLAEAEQRTQIMLDAMPMCCNFWDENLNNIDCNEAAPRLFGFSSKQEYLKRFYELSPETQPDGSPSAALVKEKIQEAFREGWVRFEWLHRKPDGEAIPAEITLVRVRRGQGYIVAGYTRDLREQKAMLNAMHKTQDELRLARDLAEKSAKAKSEFLANMSHEIRTPMNAIMGMLHLLGETGLSEKQSAYVERAEHSTRLLLRIINDILDFSKIDAGRLEMEQIDFSMERLIGNVRGLIGVQAEAKGLEFTIESAPDVPDILNGDPVRLEQILINLSNNAVKFTSSGFVSIKISRQEPAGDPGRVKLLFEVSDSGIGISREQAESLFTPFTQADTSTTRKYGGTGLGLAISRSLAELMHGSIWCEGRPEGGSRFSFTAELGCPRKAEAKKRSETLAEEAPSKAYGAADEAEDSFQSLSGLRVLLAEDNEINQMIAIELLESKGITVDAVSNGLQALKALRENSYDVILMDIQMPEMDGLSATAQIRTNPAYENLPIIAMTAHAMQGDREASLGGGMNDHLTKPIDPRLLYETLRAWDKRAKIA